MKKILLILISLYSFSFGAFSISSTALFDELSNKSCSAVYTGTNTTPNPLYSQTNHGDNIYSYEKK
jgi:hypothetical protein